MFEIGKRNIPVALLVPHGSKKIPNRTLGLIHSLGLKGGGDLTVLLICLTPFSLNDMALHVPQKERIGMCGVASAKKYAPRGAAPYH